MTQPKGTGYTKVSESKFSVKAALKYEINGGLEPPIDLEFESNRLTDRLEEIQQDFAKLPWKTDVHVSADGDASLSFERREKSWCFVWVVRELDYSNGVSVYEQGRGLVSRPKSVVRRTLLRDCSTAIKAKAASLLPSLNEAMQVEFKNRLNALREGHAALDAFSLKAGSDVSQQHNPKESA